MHEYRVIRQFNRNRRPVAAGQTVTLSNRQARHLVLGGFLKQVVPPPPAPPEPSAEAKSTRGKKQA